MVVVKNLPFLIKELCIHDIIIGHKNTSDAIPGINIYI